MFHDYAGGFSLRNIAVYPLLITLLGRLKEVPGLVYKPCSSGLIHDVISCSGAGPVRCSFFPDRDIQASTQETTTMNSGAGGHDPVLQTTW